MKKQIHITINETHDRIIQEAMREEGHLKPGDAVRAMIQERGGLRLRKRRVQPVDEWFQKLYNATVLNEAGKKFCKYPTFALIAGKLERGEVTVPIEEIDAHSVATQFDGDKGKILELLNATTV